MLTPAILTDKNSLAERSSEPKHTNHLRSPGSPGRSVASPHAFSGRPREAAVARLDRQRPRLAVLVDGHEGEDALGDLVGLLAVATAAPGLDGNL